MSTSLRAHAPDENGGAGQRILWPAPLRADSAGDTKRSPAPLIRPICLLLLAALTLAAQPKLTPIDPSGYAKLIAAHRGKIVLVDFWATWCKPCRAQTPQLAALAQKLHARGFELITISTDEASNRAAAEKVLGEDHVSGAAYLKNAADDDKFYDAVEKNWGGAVPAMFLYDRNGRKVKSFIGETPVADIQAAIEKLL